MSTNTEYAAGEETVKELHFPVSWGHIAAKAWNAPTGVPVLLTHGNMDNAGTWDQIIPLLPTSYHFVAVDLPGHGKSSHFPAGLPLKFFDFLIAIDNVVDQLNWSKFIFIGHSFGGLLGYFYSAIFPKRVERILALDAGYTLTTSSQYVENIVNPLHALKLNEEKMKSNRQPGYSFEEAIKRISTLRTYEPITELAARNLAKRGLVKSEGGYRFSMDQRLKFAERPRLSVEQGVELIKRIQCPVWTMVGTRSLIENPENWGPFEFVKMVLKKNLREYRFVVIEGHHHAVLNFPERVGKVMKEFISQRKSPL